MHKVRVPFDQRIDIHVRLMVLDPNGLGDYLPIVLPGSSVD